MIAWRREEGVAPAFVFNIFLKHVHVYPSTCMYVVQTKGRHRYLYKYLSKIRLAPPASEGGTAGWLTYVLGEERHDTCRLHRQRHFFGGRQNRVTYIVVQKLLFSETTTILPRYRSPPPRYLHTEHRELHGAQR